MESGREGATRSLTLPWPTAPQPGTIITVASGGIRRRYLVLASEGDGNGSVTAHVLDWPAFKTSAGGPYSRRLFEVLRNWRLVKARQRGVAAYVVATDATLLGIAGARPATLHELARIKGIGPQFIVTYGSDLLECILAEPTNLERDMSGIDVVQRTEDFPRKESPGIRMLQAMGRPFPADQPEPTEEAIWELVDEALTPRTAKVMSLRFGRDGQPMTLEAVGREFGLTRERIRQIQAAAFRRLAHPSRRRRLWPSADRDTERTPPSEARPPAPANQLADPEPATPAVTTAARMMQKGDMPIEELRLSARSYNALRRANKRTVADLLDLPDEELTRLRNFGRRSRQELDQRLAAVGFVRHASDTRPTPGAVRPDARTITSDPARPIASGNGARAEPSTVERRQPGTALVIGLRPGVGWPVNGSRLEQAVCSTLLACRFEMSPTQLAHVLRGSRGPVTTALHETLNLPAFGAFQDSSFDDLRAQILKLAETRPAAFVIRMSRTGA